LSAEQRQTLLAEDAGLLGKPFDVSANPRAIQAHTRHMALLLRDTAQAERASRAAEFAERMLDTLLAHDVKGPIACGKGCSWCCTTYVSASIPEVFNLARAVRQSSDAVQRVRAAAARAKAVPQHKREAKRIVCPILENNGCSFYLDRPLICRSLLSTSLDACLQILVENRATEMTHAEKTPLIRTCTVIMVKAALALCELPAVHYELIQALDVALANDNAEERWLRGEPVFANVPIDKAESDSSVLTGMVGVLVNAVRPTL
jgi:ferredoxin